MIREVYLFPTSIPLWKMWPTLNKYISFYTYAINKGKRFFLNKRSSLSIQNYTMSSEKNRYRFTERTVCIKTCGTLYDKWRNEKRFKTVPNGPLNFEVRYIDTHDISISKTSNPVVLALHGAPGSYQDFNNLASYLYHKEARVVVPSFPDFTICKPGIFRHSPEEKAQFVKDFLSATSINHIDALVVHSSAVYPGLLLCLSQDPVIKSIIMLNPGTYSLKMKFIQNMKIMQRVVRAAEVPGILSFLELIGPTVCKIIKLPVKVENVLDPLLSATCMVYADITKFKEKFLQLANIGFPILYVFSNNDKLIGKECSYDLANLLGASDSDVYVYDKDGNPIQNGKASHSLKVMSFEHGSHYVFSKHANIVLEAIANFIAEQISK